PCCPETARRVLSGTFASSRVAVGPDSRWTSRYHHTIFRGHCTRMAIEVETKDCTQLSDAELAEMADICAEGRSRFEAGLLSKQPELWVLVTLAREGGQLKGFSFSSLGRVVGNPAVVQGLTS